MGRFGRHLFAGLLSCALVALEVGVAAQAAPSVAARDQQLFGNLVVVEAVAANEPGWVDIHAEAEVAGNPGPVIGYAPVQPGENNYVLVTVDSARVTSVLYAVLHADKGQAGSFEFPGPDAPVQVDGKSVTASFHVLGQSTRATSDKPGLEVRDQVLRDGEVIVGRVVAAQPGWVDIHAEAAQAGNPGTVIGYSPVAAGETTYLRVHLPPGAVTPVLYAVLHIDEGERGKFEFPGPDAPVQLDGRSVVAPFQVLQSSVQAVTPPASTATTTSAVTPSSAPAETRTPTPPATVTTAPTATPSATPADTSSPVPTSTLGATPAPTATRVAAVQGSAAGPSPSPTASGTPGAAATQPTLAIAGTQASVGSTPQAPLLPQTGDPFGSVLSLVPWLVAATGMLFILAGIVLRRSRSRPGGL